MSTSKIVRKFERFLFKGVPEQPEHTWERNDNSLVAMRQTGKPQSITSFSEFNSGEEIIGKYIYNFEEQREEYIPNVTK